MEMPNKKSINYFLAIISGLLLAASFPPSNFGWLIFFGFIPLFWALKNARPKESFWLGLTTGLIYFTFASRWFFDTFPLDWAGVTNQFNASLLLIFFWLLNASFLALFWGSFCFSIKKYLSFSKLTVFIIPFFFVLAEYARAWGLSFLWLGTESQLGSFWTFFSPAYVLTDYFVWKKLAALGGIYLLDFLIIFINLAFFIFLFSLVKKQQKSLTTRIFAVTLIFLLLANAFSFIPQTKSEEEEISVFVLQTKTHSTFEGASAIKRFRQQVDLLKEISQKDFQKAIIFFPEDSRFLSRFPQASKIQLELLFEDRQVLIVDSSRTNTQKQEKSIISFYDHHEKQIIASSPKIFLIPGGEYLPYIVRVIAIFLGQGEFVDKFNSSRQYFSESNLTVANWQGIKIGGELCSSMMSEAIYFKATSQNANLLFNLASHSSFKGSETLAAQTLAMAKIRSLENNRFFVSSTNFGQSFVVDNQGVLVAQTENKEPQVLAAKITPVKQKSLALWGQKIVLLLSLLITFLVILKKPKILHKIHS